MSGSLTDSFTGLFTVTRAARKPASLWIPATDATAGCIQLAFYGSEDLCGLQC